MAEIRLDVVIIPENNGKYSIYSLQFPNVVTQGDSVEEAKEMLVEALKLYFEEDPQEKQKFLRIAKDKKNMPIIEKMFLEN